MAAIGGFRSDLSIMRKIDGNFGNVSAGVLFSKVAYRSFSLSRNKKINRKPFSRSSQEIVILLKINKGDTSRSFRSVRFPKPQIFIDYIGHFSVVTQKKVRRLIKRYCNDLDIKLVFSSFKIGKLFSVKDPIPGGLRLRVVYKFACAGCNACYVGETTRHFSTRVREHLVTDKASRISNTSRILDIIALCVR